MTKEEYYRKHVKLWDWLYHNPDKSKEQCPYWEWNGGDWKYATNCCHACEECNKDCNNCMFDWEAIRCSYRKNNKRRGYFNKWFFAKTIKTKKKYAKIIRNLKLKEE